MTAIPTDARFTPEQREKLAEIEAAEAAPESLRERVARAIWLADTNARERENPLTAPAWPPSVYYRRLADAALAVLRPAVVGDRAEGQ